MPPYFYDSTSTSNGTSTFNYYNDSLWSQPWTTYGHNYVYSGGMSPDYTHSQEGLPCQMLAWVTTQWILRHIGYPTGMYNDPTQITQADYTSINVPGANIGSGLVTGTTDQYRLAQQVAMNALKECDNTFKFTVA